MTRAQLAKWLAELRNPENKQTKHYLWDNEGMCCLGVCLVKVFGVEPIGTDDRTDVRLFENGSSDYAEGGLPNYIADTHFYGEVGEQRGSPKDENGMYISLAGFNDQGKSFTEIADIIEANPELYVKLED